MDSVNLAERIDQHFPQPKNNKGYQPSGFIKALILMQHCATVLNIKTLPQATTLGDWLRRMGNQPKTQEAWMKFYLAIWGLHWILDVAFDDDSNRIRKGHTAANLAVIRHLALNLIKERKLQKLA